MTEPKLTHTDLTQFTGTDIWFRHSLARNVVYTEGVKYMADKAGAHWLVDKIATINAPYGIEQVRAEPFQAWKLKVTGNTAILTATDGGKEGNDPKEIYREEITYTDFPLDEIDLWVEVGECPVILLPSEH